VTDGLTGSQPADLALVLSFGTWTDAVRRELAFPFDRLVAGAAVDPRVDRLLVADPWRSAPRTFVRYLQGRRRPELPPRTAATRLVSPMRLAREDPTDVEGLVRAYRAYDRRIETAARKLGLHRPTLVTDHPFVAGFAPLAWAGPVTYYGWDDWSELPALEPWWSGIEAAYERIRTRGHRVATVSQPIVDRIQPVGASLVVPNGLDPDEWKPPWTPPPSTVGSTRPLILYIGSIGHRLDVGVLRAVAERFGDGEVLLVGPVGDPEVLDDLAGVPNLRVGGQVGRNEVAGLVHSADVCILAHHRTPLTEAMSPLKLYEYLAAGRPVVATDLPPVRAIDPRVLLVPAGDAAGFADAVGRALALGPATEDERSRFVTENSWADRREKLLDLALTPDSPSP
jgi:glycosyltransferase involved in cell wall biosynthesis